MVASTECFQRCVGDVIRTRRKVQRLSQEQLAEITGLHRTYVSDVERGARNISIASLARLADGVGLSISAIVLQAEALLNQKEAQLHK